MQNVYEGDVTYKLRNFVNHRYDKLYSSRGSKTIYFWLFSTLLVPYLNHCLLTDRLVNRYVNKNDVIQVEGKLVKNDITWRQSYNTAMPSN